MKQNIKNSKEGYVTYHSIHNPYVGTKADVFVGNHVPMNSISKGHPIMGEPILSVEEARNQMKQGARLMSSEQAQEEMGPRLVKGSSRKFRHR